LDGLHLVAGRTRDDHVLHGQRRFQQARDRVPIIAPDHNSCRLACGFRPDHRVKNRTSDGKLQQAAQQCRVGKGGDPKGSATLMLGLIEDRAGAHTNAKQVHQPDANTVT